MRIGVVSDAHGNLEGFEACLADMGKVDKLIFAGDLLGYYFDGANILKRLRSLGAECILGNHDEFFLVYEGLKEGIRMKIPDQQTYFEKYGPSLPRAATELTADEIDWIPSLPYELTIEADRKRILVVHGSPWSPDQYVYPDFGDFDKFSEVNADVVVMGHTHHPMVKTIGNVTLINSGSCGQPRDRDPRASYGIIEIDSGVVSCATHRVAYSQENVLKQCHEFAPHVPLLTSLLLRNK